MPDDNTVCFGKELLPWMLKSIISMMPPVVSDHSLMMMTGHQGQTHKVMFVFSLHWLITMRQYPHEVTNHRLEFLMTWQEVIHWFIIVYLNQVNIIQPFKHFILTRLLFLFICILKSNSYESFFFWKPYLINNSTFILKIVHIHSYKFV